MGDDVFRLAVVGQIVRRRWRSLTVLAVVGALLGAGTWLLVSPGFAATSMVVLHGPVDKGVLQTEAQIAQSLVVLDRAAEGSGGTGQDLRNSVTAQVGEGNVIAIRGTARSPQAALELTDRVTRSYLVVSGQLATDAAANANELLQSQRSAAQRKIEDANRRISELERSPGIGAGTPAGAAARAELETMRAAVSEANNELQAIDRREEDSKTGASAARSDLDVIELIDSGPADPTLLQLTIAGAALFFTLGTLALMIVMRSDRRLRRESEIAAALGTRALGNVLAPDEPGGDPAHSSVRRRHGWRDGAYRLLHDNLPWDALELSGPGDYRQPWIPYRRVLARVRGEEEADLRLRVVIPEDDGRSHRAVALLAAAAAETGTVIVLTDVADFGQLVADAAAEDDVADRVEVWGESDLLPGSHHTLLHVSEVSATKPELTDGNPASGVVIVLASGTRTPHELVGIAEACEDSGHQVLGSIVVYPAQPAPSDTERAVLEDAAEPQDEAGTGADLAEDGTAQAGDDEPGQDKAMDDSAEPETADDDAGQDETEQDETEQDETEQDETEQDETGQDETGQDETEHDPAEQDGQPSDETTAAGQQDGQGKTKQDTDAMAGSG